MLYLRHDLSVGRLLHGRSGPCRPLYGAVLYNNDRNQEARRPRSLGPDLLWYLWPGAVRTSRLLLFRLHRSLVPGWGDERACASAEAELVFPQGADDGSQIARQRARASCSSEKTPRQSKCEPLAIACKGVNLARAGLFLGLRPNGRVKSLQLDSPGQALIPLPSLAGVRSER